MSFMLLGILNSQAAAAAAGAYELIESNILTASASSVTFSSIPQDYKSIQIRGVVKSSHPFSTLLPVDLQINGVSSSSYSIHSLNAFAVAVGGTSSVNQTKMTITEFLASSRNGVDGIFSNFVMDLVDYSATTKNTTMRMFRSCVFDTGDSQVNLTSGMFNQTAAVTDFNFASVSGSFVVGSRFSLYGIRG